MLTPSTNTPTPEHSPSEDSTKYFVGPVPQTPSRYDTHANITLNESDELATLIGQRKPVYVDTDYLGIANVAAVSRYEPTPFFDIILGILSCPCLCEHYCFFIRDCTTRFSLPKRKNLNERSTSKSKI